MLYECVFGKRLIVWLLIKAVFALGNVPNVILVPNGGYVQECFHLQVSDTFFLTTIFEFAKAIKAHDKLVSLKR